MRIGWITILLSIWSLALIAPPAVTALDKSPDAPDSPQSPDSPSEDKPKQEKSDRPVLKVFVGQQGVEYPPLCIWRAKTKDEPEPSDPKGHEPDVMRALAKRMNVTLKFVSMPDNIDVRTPRIDLLERRIVDLVLYGYTITAKRGKRVLFSDPYYTDGLAVIVRTDSKIKTVEELDGKKILTLRHTTAYTWAKEHLPKAELVTLMPRDYQGTAQSLVDIGRVKAYLNDRLNLTIHASENTNLRMLPDVLSTEHWGIAAHKDNASLIKKVNAALAKLRKSGRLKKIDDKWFKPKDESDGDEKPRDER